MLDGNCHKADSDHKLIVAPKSTEWASSGTGVMIRRGISIFGVSLTSQSGWSTHVKSEWENVGTVPRAICSVYGEPNTAPITYVGGAVERVERHAKEPPPIPIDDLPPLGGGGALPKKARFSMETGFRGLSTAAGATAALTSTETLITRVATKRATLGADRDRVANPHDIDDAVATTSVAGGRVRTDDRALAPPVLPPAVPRLGEMLNRARAAQREWAARPVAQRAAVLLALVIAVYEVTSCRSLLS